MPCILIYIQTSDKITKLKISKKYLFHNLNTRQSVNRCVCRYLLTNNVNTKRIVKSKTKNYLARMDTLCRTNSVDVRNPKRIPFAINVVGSTTFLGSDVVILKNGLQSITAIFSSYIIDY